ncbi:hypothetical protein JD276_04515 [Leucobacter sp. CSA1]|uniref:Uncharacterized protein n=1 Tax=Leucobacter chromiisoli TaxID=2796471 RepID=A0A934UUK7_9MICO|nr:hypothetical protein [Leucobacter chromiisoli]MBK0418293.1 hypothetical protein [Leucobacter chromiisoli]
MTQAEMEKMLEDRQQAVEALTGFKQAFVLAGWNETVAEQMVLAMVHSGGKK